MSSSKQNNIDKIFKSEPYLNADLILDYLDNKLAPEKRHKVEKALIADPFLSEAIEGLEQMSSEHRKTIIYDLLGKEQKEAIIIPYRLIGIAAATIIGISTIFLITKSLLTPSTQTIAYQETKEEVDENRQKGIKEVAPARKVTEEPEIEANGESDEITDNNAAEEEASEPEEEIVEQAPVAIEDMKRPQASASKKKAIAADSMQAVQVLKQGKENASQMAVVASDEEKPIAEVKSDPQKTPQELALTMIKTLKSKTSSSSYNVTGAISRSAAEGEVADMSKKEANALENYALGVSSFNKGDYKDSQEKLETAYKKDSNVGDVKFFLAASYLCGSNNFSKAKKVFQADNTQSLTQEKQWLQAIIYLSDGKVDIAKSQLEKIATTGNSSFKEEADTILKNLKE